mgnify:CR=1 FL=1
MQIYELEIMENDEMGYHLQLDDEILEDLGWETGDMLEWSIEGDGIKLRKL